MKMLLLASALTALSLPALAWNNIQPGPGPNQIVDGGPGAQATSRSTSSATGVGTGGNGYGGAGGTGYGGAGGTAYGGSGGRGGSATNTVTVNGGGGSGGGDGWNGNPVASAIAPSFYNGANPCLGSAASASGQAPMFGLSFGGQQMDVSCQALRLGEVAVAREVLCIDDRSYRRARFSVGDPCNADREKFNEEHPRPVMQPVSSPIADPNWCRNVDLGHRALTSSDAARYVSECRR